MNSLTLRRDGKAVKPEALLPKDDVSAGEKTRVVLDELRQEIKSIDDVLVVSGQADFGASRTLLLPECTIRHGRWRTHCKIDRTASEVFHKVSDTPETWESRPGATKLSATCGFSIGRFARFENFFLGGDCWDVNEDGGLIGFVGNAEAVVEFDGCHLDASQGMDWGLYAWNSGARRTIRMCDTTFDYCAIGIAAAASGGRGQMVVVDGCLFRGDANGTRSIGASRDMGPDPNKWGVLTAVLCRMGDVQLRDSHFAARGLKQDDQQGFGCPRIAAAGTNHYYDTSGPTAWKVERCSSSIIPGTARESCDIDLRGERYTYDEVGPAKLAQRQAG